MFSISHQWGTVRSDRCAKKCLKMSLHLRNHVAMPTFSTLMKYLLKQFVLKPLEFDYLRVQFTRVVRLNLSFLRVRIGLRSRWRRTRFIGLGRCVHQAKSVLGTFDVIIFITSHTVAYCSRSRTEFSQVEGLIRKLRIKREVGIEIIRRIWEFVEIREFIPQRKRLVREPTVIKSWIMIHRHRTQIIVEVKTAAGVRWQTVSETQARGMLQKSRFQRILVQQGLGRR